MPRLHLGGIDRRRSGPSSSRRGAPSSHRAKGVFAVASSSSSSQQAAGPPPPSLSSSSSSSLPPMPAAGTYAPDDSYHDNHDDVFEFYQDEERDRPSDDDNDDEEDDDPHRELKSSRPAHAAGVGGEEKDDANRDGRRSQHRPFASERSGAAAAGNARWLENYNLLRPCIAGDGSVDYSTLDDDDDDGAGTTRKRIRNFVKEQRRRYTKLVGDDENDDGGGISRLVASDERLRLLDEAGFDFRPSVTNKAHAKGKERTSTAKADGGDERRKLRHDHPGRTIHGKIALRRDDLECLRDTDDDEMSDECDDKSMGAVCVRKKEGGGVAKRRSVEENVPKRLKGARDAAISVATKSEDIGTGVGDDRHRLKRTVTQVLPLRILAVDNRVLSTPMDDSSARYSFLDNIAHLVHGGLERGLLSSFSAAATGKLDADDGGSTIVAALSYATTRGGSRRCEDHTVNTGVDVAPVGTSVVPHLSYLFERDDGKVIGEEERTSWLSDLLRPVRVNITTEDDNASRGFAAADGWGYFGDLVEAIERKLSRPRGREFRHARPITLFTTDANLFADTASSSHVSGLERFWKRIRVAFDVNAVSSITIVIVETTSIMHMMTTTLQKHHNSHESLGLPGDDGRALDAPSLPSRLHVMHCINDIQRRIMELHQSQCLESNHSTKTSIKLNLEFIEGNSVSFHSLLQAWTNEAFDQTYASLWNGINGIGAGVRGRLSFDLPETLDGMCSISLDLQYTLLPDCIHSPATVRLVEEMLLFSILPSSSVEVLQTVPLSSVDSSLIFGVPMSARASLEDDICRYNEMKILARQLWKYLSRNDVALVLLVRTPESKNNPNRTTVDAGEQLFLLTCEDAVQKQSHALKQDVDIRSTLTLDSESLQIIPDKSREGRPPCSGMLYRYATKGQLLRFGNEESSAEANEEDLIEMSDYYLDYIERSLDTLVKTGMNPLLIGRGRS